MEKREKEDGAFQGIEWTIENFSCWNKEIHGNVIESPESCYYTGLAFKLYPRGLNGDGEHLVVGFENSNSCILEGDLSFFVPDGILLCKQQVDNYGNLSGPPRHTFEEIVRHIKKNELLHKDILTVRLEGKYFGTTEYNHTILEVFQVSLKMAPETLDNLNALNPNILSINYPLYGKDSKTLYLKASKDKKQPTKVMLQLIPDKFVSNVSVRTRTYFLKGGDEMVNSDENEHLFRDGSAWSFPITLTVEEWSFFREKQASLICELEVIPRTSFRHSSQILKFFLKDVVFPSNCFLSPSPSVASTNSMITVNSNQRGESVTVLSKELMCLYQDQDFSDFTLKCDNVSIPVHKNILSARSPVFKNMLSSDMKEAASNEVVITDLDPSTLARFLAFLYTGGVEDLQCDTALDLYYAAEKYEVPTLKKECTDYLSGNVSISNVCDILSLANRHQDHHLIGVARDFILNNYNDVLGSEKWETFMRREPLLAVETLTYFAAKKYVKKS